MAKKQKNPQPVKVPVAAGSSFITSLKGFLEGKELFACIVGLVVMTVVVLHDYLFLNNVYLFKDIGSDTVNGAYPAIAHLSEYLRTEGLPGWSFKVGMGNNIYPFSIGEPFFLAIYLLGKYYGTLGLAYMEAAKIIIGGTVFFLYGRTRQFSGYASFMGSILYAFSGYMILGGTWFLFSTDAVYVALLLYAFELYFIKGRWWLFPLVIMLMAMTQPFYLYTYSVFMLLYIPIRYVERFSWNWKAVTALIVKLLVMGALGLLMASVISLSEIRQMLDSPRVGGEASYTARLSARPMFFLESALHNQTVIARLFSNDLMGTGSNFKGWMNYLEAPILYIGLITLLLFPQIFATKDKRRLLWLAGIAVICIVPLIFPYFRYAFWLFSGDYYRAFSFIVALTFLLWAIQTIDVWYRSATINIPLIAGTLLLLLILLFAPFSGTGIIHTGLRGFIILLMVSQTIVVCSIKIPLLRQIMPLVLLCIVSIELMYFATQTTGKRDVIKVQDLTSRTGYNDHSVDAVQYLKSRDRSLYRIDKDYYSSPAIHAGLNDARIQGYNGTSAYHNFNHPYYIKFLSGVELINPANEYETRWASGVITRPMLQSLCHVKYVLSNNEQNGMYWRRIGYIPLHTTGTVTIFSNPFVLPFGCVYHQVISEQTFQSCTRIQKEKVLLHAAVVHNSNPILQQLPTISALPDTSTSIEPQHYKQWVNTLKQDSLTIEHWSENIIRGTISLKQAGILYLSFPFDKGWKAEINGKEQPLMVLQLGLTGLLLEQGNSTVELRYTPPFVREGFVASIIGFILYIALVWRFKTVKSQSITANNYESKHSN